MFDATPTSCQACVALPATIAPGRAAVADVLDPHLDTADIKQVWVDASATSVLGPGFCAELVEQLCVKRRATMVVFGAERSDAERFERSAFELGVAGRVRFVGTVDTAEAFARPLP